MSFQDKVVYQIYPKSFKDSNGDGIGDIRGIIEKLDYLENLGIDYIWLTPVFPSPQNDNGYDVKDYYDIDPLFGTMGDMEDLIKEAAKRNIYIMLDMVFNHTSTEHPWFQKALAGDVEYKERYIFRKGRNGQPPTNWESKFKGNAWKYVEKFDEYYLHLFHETQADLNWKNPEVRKEAANIVKFWMNKGIKGFRFDVINLIDKEKFEDDYQGEGKRFYTDRPGVHKYLKELNRNSFGQDDGIITVGEMSSTSVENCIGYTNPDNEELTMVFSFHHLKVDYDETNRWSVVPPNYNKLKQLLHTWQLKLQEGNGWNALFWCCHDQPRVLSRYGNDKKYPKESAKMLAAMLHMMRGTPYIYQGEEIGMTNAYFTDIKQYKDIDAWNSYREMKREKRSEEEIHRFLQARSRDNARTPMQWNAEKNASFSEAEPWISMTDNYREVNVRKNLEDPDSVFYYYQTLITIRKKYKVIQDGLYEPIYNTPDSVFAYRRKNQDQEITVYSHLSDDDAEIFISSSDYDIILSNVKREVLQDRIKLKPYESIVIIRK